MLLAGRPTDSGSCPRAIPWLGIAYEIKAAEKPRTPQKAKARDFFGLRRFSAALVFTTYAEAILPEIPYTPRHCTLVESMKKTLVGHDQWHPSMLSRARCRGTEESQLLVSTAIHANSTVLSLGARTQHNRRQQIVDTRPTRAYSSSSDSSSSPAPWSSSSSSIVTSPRGTRPASRSALACSLFKRRRRARTSSRTSGRQR